MFTGVVVAASLLLSAELPGALVVQTAGDGAAGCAAGEELANALERRLPGTRVVRGGGATRGDFQVSLAPEGTAWRLRVARGEDGETVLAREIRPAAEAGCAAVVATGVLMIDRLLSDIAWAGKDPQLGAEGGVAVAPPAPAAGAGSVKLGVAAGLVAWTELPAHLSPAVAVDFSVRWKRLLVAAWGAATSRESQPVLIDGFERGSLSARRLMLGVSGGACGGLGVGEWCAGGLGGVGGLAGGAAGAGLANTREALATVPVAGLFGGLGRALGWGFDVGLEARVAAPLGEARLTVDGTGARAGSPRVYGLLAVRLGWRMP